MTDGASSASALKRAAALLDVGRCEEAATAARELLAIEPTNVSALVLLSRALRDTHPLESLELARTAVSLEPGAAWLHVNAAWAADEAGRMGDAFASARRAIALNPQSAAAFQALAQLLTKAGQRIPEAAEAANMAVELAPHDPASWITAGNVAFSDKNFAEARRFYEHALALQPDNRAAQLNLAAIHQRKRNVGHAMDLLQTIIRVNPHDQTAQNRLEDLARALLNEIVWLSLAVGFALAIAVVLVTGRG